jgi:thiamine biosynthesis lipoprotein
VTAAWEFEAIGTHWRIDSAAPVPPPARARVEERIGGYDRAFSRFRPDSLVSTHARDAGCLTYPEEAAPLFALYLELAAITDGRVTPLVGGSLERLGYDAGYALTPTGAPEAAPRLAETLTVDGSRLTLRRPALLDVGAAGKGQLVDLVAAELAAAGALGVTVDAGGDLRHDGDEPLGVALEHPYDPTAAVGVVELAGERRAIAGSAGNRRAWGDGWHHIIDGSTGLPVRSVVATWALASTAMLADALATALFFVPGSVLEQDYDLDWVRVLADGTVEWSPSLPGRVFLA